MCTELKKSSISSKICTKCSAADHIQYIKFQDDVCRGVFPPKIASSIIAPPISTPKVSPLPVYKSTTPVKNVTTTTVPVSVVSTTVVRPTTLQTVTPPRGPSVPVVPPPQYTGGAAGMKMGA